MDNVNIQLSKDLIAPIIENKVKMAIIEAMGDGKALISSVVESVLSLKVDEKGQRQSSDYYNKYTFIDIVLKQGIENACRQAIKEYINENKDKIREETKRQLCTKRGTGMFVESFLKGMLKATESDYRFTAEFGFQTLKDE
jgi:hypothetical protein